MRNSKQEVLNFWFMETEPQLWFMRSDEFAESIRDRFEVTYNLAADGLCHDWAVDAAGSLALCLVLDQFPRRLYRDTGKAYATDEKALLVAKQAVHKGFDQVLPHEQRFFLYLPFEHSEKLADQKRNLELFKAMAHENPIAYRTAQQRFELFERFGRFPQRNEALKRESTPEELEWLKTFVPGAC
jgi:uncharacterized protein (DUF924 family)